MTSATPVNNHMGRRVDDDQGAYCADGRVRTGVASGSLVQTDPTPCSPVTGEADKPASLKSAPLLPVRGVGGFLFRSPYPSALPSPRGCAGSPFMWKPQPPTTPDILYGSREICAYLRITETTLIRWRRKFGLPVSLSPAGVLMLPRALVDRWSLGRYRQQIAEGNRNGTHPRRSGRNPAVD